MEKSIKKIFLTLCAALFIVITAALSAYAFSFRNMTLDFIHISDTHITQNRADTSYKALSSSSDILKDAIEQINDIKGLDFVLFTGDLVDSSTSDNYRQYFTLMTKLKYPTLNSFGNHDLAYGNLSRGDALEYVRKCNRNYIFDDTYYAFTPKSDYRIIILDSTIDDENSSNGRISQEQLNFLDKELESNQDKIVVIAFHHPAIEPFKSSEHALVNAKEFNEILLKYKNPIVILNGHYHAAKIRQIGNLVYVSTPSMVTYPMAFRHIKIVNYKDRVNYTFEFIPTRLEQVREKNRQSVISYSTLEGLPADRELAFTYMKKNSKSAKYKRNKIENANKVSKTSKKEIKKLTTPKAQKEKAPKLQRVKKEKTPKVTEPKMSLKNKIKSYIPQKLKKETSLEPSYE